MSNRKAVFDLFLASALGLFLELLVIRWIGTEMRLFAFYRNFALIAAFLGLGIGFALQHRVQSDQIFNRDFLRYLAILSFLIVIIGRTPLNQIIVLNSSTEALQEYVWTSYVSTDLAWVAPVAFYITLSISIFLLVLTFIPLGKLTASKFAAFQPLQGYTINIAGSLIGILLYTLVSWLRLPPPVWFVLAGAAILYFIPRSDKRLFITSIGLAIFPVLLTLLWPTGAQRTVWSPYYRIGLSPAYAESDSSVLLGYDLTVNQEWHQALLNLDYDFVEENFDSAPGHFSSQRTDYEVPYQVANSLDNVLIVGAGTGNDAAAALRAGAERVVAVEIDPAILDLGTSLHPESPYTDPRIIAINQDARTYFRNADETFDLIVFGRLDSQTLFGTASSVRLDNFVYTRESLSEVRGLLKDDGIIAMSFKINALFVGDRLQLTLEEVFGHSPQVYQLPTDHTLFLIGLEPFDEPLLTAEDNVRPITLDPESISIATDNWPYLYLQRREIPTPYLAGLVIILVTGLLITRMTLPNFRQFNLHFFFMGAAFFLLETKSITELALLFGSTWVVNAAVITAILTMIVLANILVLLFQPANPMPFYALLALTLLGNYLFPVSSFLGLPPGVRVLLASAAMTVPLFFAGIIFAVTFNQTDSIEIALGSNLIGAVLGGVTEYLSLALGIQSLLLLALVFYILSAVSLLKFGPSSTGQIAPVSR